MFQTEIILFLQSFESVSLNAFFAVINATGYSSFFIQAIFVIMFGVDFRKGFYLLHVLLWTAGITALLKIFFALPRPCDVDLNVKLINKEYPNPTTFESMGASHFWGGLPHEVITYYRNIKDYSYGIPSGHVSSTTVFWGAISQLSQQIWIRMLAIMLIVFMPLTRMYLGRHFFADVITGFRSVFYFCSASTTPSIVQI
jgi:membrane-associated phospholipid phosphatase